MFAKWPCFHSESVFLIVKISITFKRTQNGKKKWSNLYYHPCLVMRLMKSLNGYCFSFDIKKWPDAKSFINTWSRMAERKREPPTLLSSSECITSSVDDTGSKYTGKPTTLYYYEYNYHGRSLVLVNLLLKIFLVHLNLHNQHAMNYFFWKCVFCSLCFHTKIS